MPQMSRISRNNTSVETVNGETRVVLHRTCVIKWDDKTITLNSGGWRTVTTKTRINQAASQYELGISVYQSAGQWFVGTGSKGVSLPFADGMIIKR